MCTGSTDHSLHHLVYEIVANGTDEAMAGYCDRVDVVIEADAHARADNVQIIRRQARAPASRP
jgi:DNA gyrase/topoisomerase IV subunit B